jgi:DNA-binding LacI/PurR family transcriptional regulator
MAHKVTLKHIAEELGIPVSTVSLAINNRPGVNKERREKVLRTCQDMGYRAKKAGSRKIARRGYVCHLIYSGKLTPGLPPSIYVPTDPHPVFPLQVEAERRGYELLTYYVSDADLQEMRVPRIYEKGLKGVFVDNLCDKDYVRLLAAQGVPLVLSNFDPIDPPVDCVLSDDYNGAMHAMRYLIEHGHRRIGLIGGIPSHPSNHLRVVAYGEALRQADIPLDPAIVIDDLPLANSVEAGAEAATQILNACGGHLDAIFCITDDLALGCLKAVRERGLRVPQDISVMGFDDKEFAPYADPPLTTMRWPRRRMTLGATARLFELIAPESDEHVRAPRKIVFPVALVERNSVAAKASEPRLIHPAFHQEDLAASVVESGSTS